MDRMKSKRALTLLAAAVIIGAIPACTPTNDTVRPENYIYGQTTTAPLGTGPGIGCNRNPPPSQC
jgi:hypothetical protein